MKSKARRLPRRAAAALSLSAAIFLGAACQTRDEARLRRLEQQVESLRSEVERLRRGRTAEPAREDEANQVPVKTEHELEAPEGSDTTNAIAGPVEFSFEVSPPDAAITVDSKPVDGARMGGLTRGATHYVRVTRMGYRTVSQQVVADADRQLRYTLVPGRGFQELPPLR